MSSNPTSCHSHLEWFEWQRNVITTPQAQVTSKLHQKANCEQVHVTTELQMYPLTLLQIFGGYKQTIMQNIEFTTYSKHCSPKKLSVTFFATLRCYAVCPSLDQIGRRNPQENNNRTKSSLSFALMKVDDTFKVCNKSPQKQNESLL